MTRICCNKGTKIMNSELSPTNWFVHDKTTQSRISQDKTGHRLNSSKGTTSLWIRKLPKIETIQSLKVIIQNKGTKRSEQIF